MNETGFGSPNVNPVISGVQLLFERELTTLIHIIQKNSPVMPTGQTHV